MSETIYSVSFMVSENDNGNCLSYTSEEQRDEAANWMREQGYYHVSKWSA